MGRSRPGETPSGPAPIEYQGFSGTWDSRAHVFVFTSCDERDRWQIAYRGHVRYGFREPDEPEDDRPVISRHRCQCKGCRERKMGDWKDNFERATYEAAVAGNSKRDGEGPGSYIRRISLLVTEENKPKLPVRRMPKAGRVRL